MRRTKLAAGALGMWLATSCGSDASSVCELAHARLDECRVESFPRSGYGALLFLLQEPQDCAEQTRCVAECAVRAPCDALVFVAEGGSDPNQAVPGGTDELWACLSECA